MSGVWVFVENRDGEITTIAKEAIGAARTVADELVEDLTGLVFGENVSEVAGAAFDAVGGEVLPERRVEARLDRGPEIQARSQPRGRGGSSKPSSPMRSGSSRPRARRAAL